MTAIARRASFHLLMALIALAAAASCARAAVGVTTGKVEGAPGKDVEVPILVKGAKDAKGVSCMSLRLNYDPALLTFKSLDKGPALPNAIFDKSIDDKADPGKIGLGFACGSKTTGGKEMAAVDSDGVVLKVIFTVNDKAEKGKKAPLKIDNIRALDTDDEAPSELSVTSEDGEFLVIGGPFALPSWWIYVAIGIGVLLLLLIVILATRGRKKEEPAGPRKDGAGDAALPRFTPQASTFKHKCTQCGGVIPMPVAMVGQSFQCGACGATQVGTPS